MSRTPEWNVAILNKATEERGRVGVAWNNEDGSIGIVLNPCVVLRSSPDLVITLFPREKGIFKQRTLT